MADEMPQIQDCSDIATNLAAVRALISAAAEAKGRLGESVTLIAGDARLAIEVGAQGLHLPEYLARRLACHR